MSKDAVAWAARQKIGNQPMKAVLKALAYLHKNGADLFPSQQRLSADTGVSVRTVREALWLLGHFGVISRKPRSAGARGRTSDLFILSLRDDFTLTTTAISTVRRSARKSSSNRRAVPLAKNSQPAPRAGGCGAARRGIGDEQKNKIPSQIDYPTYQLGSTCEEGDDRPRLTLLAGGKP